METTPLKPDPGEAKGGRSLWGSLRRYLLTGIVVSAPVGVTAFVLYWIFGRLDAIVGGFLRNLGLRLPGLGLLILIVFLIIVGWLAQQAVGHQLIGLGRKWLSRFPLTRSIYNAASQIVETLVGENRKLFKACVLIQYPREGLWSLGFVTSMASQEVSEIADETSIAVFVPTAPNPTSGYILFVPVSQVRRLRMSVEEGFRVVISGGAVVPGVPPEVSASDIRRLIERGERERRVDA